MLKLGTPHISSCLCICVTLNRTTRSHRESEIGPSSSDNLKRNHVSPKKVEMERSPSGSLLPLKNLKDTCTSKSEGKIDLTNISSDTSEDFTGQQGNLNSMKKRDVNFSATEAMSDNKDCCFASCKQKNVDGIFRDIPTNLETSNTVFELQDNDILNSSIKNSACTNPSESKFIQDKFPVLQVNKTQPAKTELREKYMKDTLSPNTIPVGASGDITLNVNQTAEHSFSEQTNEHSKIITQNAAACRNELPQSACTPIYNSSHHPFGTSYPYYAWCVYHYSNSSGSSITQTYQGITSYDVQPPPAMLTAIASNVQSAHYNLLYSQYFGYFSGEPQANDFVPVNGYFQSQMPVSYNFQPPTFSQYPPHQAFPQAVYPYPPDSGVLPQVPWTYGEFYKF